MDVGDRKLGPESQDSGSPASVGNVSGIFSFDKIKLPVSASESTSPTMSPKIAPTSKGIENAKKRLRAFSIQKKNPLPTIAVPKPVSTGNTTVLIGKLNSVKVTPKNDDPVTEQKKPPKPPKPGSNKKHIQDYIDQQKKTLSEIEDMKRKMELVELGIPLGLICPSQHNYKAMPTKAMPPIKSFLADNTRARPSATSVQKSAKLQSEYTGIIPVTSPGNSAKVDEIILEAKKAKAEGKRFKFDYQKLLPDYDNPFQRKKDEPAPTDRDKKSADGDYRSKSRDSRKSDKYDRSHSYRRVDKGKYRDDRDNQREERKHREKDDKKEKDTQKGNTQKDSKETDVNLNDYLVCDSWSLDNEDKSNSSPKIDDSVRTRDIPLPKEILPKTTEEFKELENVSKIKKLKPVIDSFEYEIDPNEDEILNIFDSSSCLDKYSKVTVKKNELNDSPKDGSDVNDDKFLQSVINEIKEEDSCDDISHDKGLVEYDVSPPRDNESQSDQRGSVTPELKSLNSSQRSDYSDSYISVESGYKSTESGYKSNVSVDSQFMVSTEREFQGNLSRSTMNSLETWSFVLKICQPLLFRHDRNNCYRETQTTPKLWYTENPRMCNCVKDRSIVYEELEMFKMNLVDRVYGCDQIPDAPFPGFRSWYPKSTQCLATQCPAEQCPVQLPANDDWEADDSQVEPNRNERGSMTPQKNEEIYLDREYQKFMQALSDVSEHKADNSRSTTPVTMENKAGEGEEKRKAKKRFSSEGWSQESDLEEDSEKGKKLKLDKEKQRKRKYSTSSVTSSSEDHSKKKKKSTKKKESKKSKASKRRRLSKKYLKKLKEKQKKKKRLMKLVQESDDDDDDDEEEVRRKDKKLKKKKQQKLKHSKQKKKKSKAKSSSSSESSTTSESSSSETDSEVEKRSRKKKKDAEDKKKKRKKSTSEFKNDDLFDVNILNNIKTERTTDDEKQITPRKKPREIINVKELQNDFVGNNIHIKKEVEEKMTVDSTRSIEEPHTEAKQNEEEPVAIEPDNNVEESNKDVFAQNDVEVEDIVEQKNVEEVENFQGTSETKKLESIDMKKEEKLKEKSADQRQTTPPHHPADESSQCSSQGSTSKELYEKDESHLRPSSQNSNYNFNDVIASHGSYTKEDPEDKFQDGYEHGNYELYEQLAYQTDVDTQMKGEDGERRIETVVRARVRGEIKCDWRAGDEPLHTHHRPSRWGLKPGEVNIVLTGGSNPPEQFPVCSVLEPQPELQTEPQLEPQPEPQPVYQIQSLANRSDNCNISYDEAYMDTYGALDRLQYGDCFSENAPAASTTRVQSSTTSSLDERISQVLQNSVLSEITKETEDTETDKDGPEKGILITKPVVTYESTRVNKRVSFADGYKPGQDSDVEEPPVKKRKRARRLGCAWPCPASHPDHVPLWDALPPPPPPPGSPPAPPPPPTHQHHTLPLNVKYDPTVSLLNFMPPEPPPGLLTF